MARRPYTTRYRPFKDDPTEVTLLWYPADPRAGTLPFASVVNSLDWHTSPWAHEGPGEVYGAPRNFNRARRRLPGVGPHFCGTREDFADGESFNPDLPRTVYNGADIPMCCTPGEVAAGGAVFGGDASVSGGFPADVSGGVVFGGTALVSDNAVSFSRGGVVFGGTALVSDNAVSLSRGGIVFCGEANEHRDGDSCLTALPLYLWNGVPTLWPQADSDQWYVNYEADKFHAWHITFDASVTDDDFDIWGGTDCEHRHLLGKLHTGERCWEFTTAMLEPFFWIELHGPGPTTAHFTFVVLPGPCDFGG